MKWNKKDTEQYILAKEYVDTIILPLIPFNLSLDSDVTKSSYQGEVLTVFSNELEKELTGRVMLIPTYHYLKSAPREEEVKRINAWVDEVKKQPFSHIFFITFDPTWKKSEQALQGNLLWLPGIQSGEIHSQEVHNMIRDQVSQVSELIRSYW